MRIVVADVILLSSKHSLKYACRPHKQNTSNHQMKTKRTHIITYQFISNVKLRVVHINTQQRHRNEK